MRWFLYLIPHVVLSVLRYPLAVIAVAFFSSPDKRRLNRMRWLETIDNDLSGDDGWRGEHLIGNDPLSFINRVRWLWRNGANAVNYGLLGVPVEGGRVMVRVAYPAGQRIVREDGAWMYRRFFKIGARYLEIYIGWALMGPQRGRCKFILTVRGRTGAN